MSISKSNIVIAAFLLLMSAGLFLLGGCGSAARAPEIILATTTSTQDSGLLDVLVPEFEKETGFRVKVVAVGSGAALEMGKRGEADVLLVHSPQDEIKLVESGIGIDYRLVMHNDFVVLGPPEDPAGIKGCSAAEAFKRIAAKKATFVSRGDESGTHKKEKEIWSLAGVEPGGAWYHQSGSGMGQTINITNDKRGYTLADRGTFLAHKKNIGLEVLVENDKNLLNIFTTCSGSTPVCSARLTGMEQKLLLILSAALKPSALLASTGKMSTVSRFLFRMPAKRNRTWVRAATKAKGI